MSTFYKILVMFFLAYLLTACSNGDQSGQAAAYLERSLAYEKQGQFRAAMIETRNAIKVDPENETILERYADLLITVGSVQQATEILETIDNNDARIKLANAYLDMGKFISAGELLNNIEPDAGDSNSELALIEARIAFLAGNREQSYSLFQSAIDQNPDNLDARKQFIEHLLQGRQEDRASELIETALASNPDDGDLLFYTAAIAMQQNELELAENALTSALAHLPETDMLLNEKQRVLSLLSDVLTKMGRTTDALVYNRIIREANPEGFVAQQQYRDALQAAANGELDAAKAAFEDILSQFPNNQQAAQLLGLVNLRTGNLVEGEQLLTENIDTETAPITLIQATAMAQAELGKVNEALAVLEKALLARPDDTTLLSLLGIISLNNNENDRGIKALNKALQLEPGRSRLHLILAQFYNNEKKPDMALGHLRKAYAEVPDDIATTGYYLNTLINENEFAEAREISDQISARLSDNKGAQLLVAITNFRMGDRTKALSQLESLYKEATDNLNVITVLARLYDEEELFKSSSEMWLNALQTDNSNPTHIENAVRARLKTTDVLETTEWLMTKAQEIPESRLLIHSVVLQLRAMSGNIESAKEILSMYDGTDNEVTRQMRLTTLRTEAMLTARSGNFAEALPIIEAAIELKPSDQNLTIMAAQLDGELDGLPAAMNRLDNFLDVYEDNLLVVSEKARLLVKTSGQQDALDYIRPFWNQKPTGQLASVYFQLVRSQAPGDYETALNQLIDEEPGNTRALVSLGDYFVNQNASEDAVLYYEKALNTDPNSVMALNNLAWIISSENPEQALQYAKKASELAPNDGAVLDTYGWILYQQGQTSLAIQILEKAVKLAPDSPEIQSHLEQAKSSI